MKRRPVDVVAGTPIRFPTGSEPFDAAMIGPEIAAAMRPTRKGSPKRRATVLVTQQPDAAENGVYTVTDPGAPGKPWRVTRG